MPKKRISEPKLMAIASELRKKKQDIMKLAINLGLSAADVEEDALDCFTVLLKAMSATTIKDQKNKLRKGLIKSGYKATASKHLPSPTNKTEPARKTRSRTAGLPTDRRSDSSRQHGAEGPSHPSTSHDNVAVSLRRTTLRPAVLPTERRGDGRQNPTVRPANPEFNGLDRKMQYVMWESLVKGSALIIGNAVFPQPVPPRPWAEMDINNMQRLLEELGYNLQNDQNIHRNLSKSGMEQAVQAFMEQLENDEPQSAVVYISSHGNETGIEGSDRNILPIPFLIGKLSKVLLGKPKVIIVDACWGGGETRRLQVSVPNSSSGAQTVTGFPENADIFFIHSTSLGKTAWSQTDEGSWFVKQLCEVVYNNDRDLEDLDTIMLRVTQGMRTMTARRDGITDNGTQSTTVLKQGVDRKLFFYPGFEI